jgi:hypothetical protein
VDDQSHLDSKYFIDESIYNCPFCNRRHVTYENLGYRSFGWSKEKACYAWLVECNSCANKSLHLTFTAPATMSHQDRNGNVSFRPGVELDRQFFYSVPTSFFAIDRRIPRVIRELVTEAEGCAKMNYLTGASACTRKAIYEFLALNSAEGDNYDDKIKWMKARFPAVDAELFDVLGMIKDMTSDKVHEQSWASWDSKHLYLFLGALKAGLHEIYVVPDEKKARADEVRKLRAAFGKKGESAAEPGEAPVADRNLG